MKGYIALLRGINVSGQKKIIMTDLKAMFKSLGFASVVTYIQSGNIVFESEKEEIPKIEDIIKQGIFKTFGYEVPVLVLTHDELKSIYEDNPFLDRITEGEIEEKKMFFTLLSHSTEISTTKKIEQASGKGEEFVVAKKVVYFFAANGYGKTKLNNNFFEKKLKCNATTRNMKTVIKLLELSDLN